jgi:hypothetical protein
METIEVQLPATLVRQVQKVIASDKPIEQALAEAVQLWLDRQHQLSGPTEAEQALLFLRQAGLVMSAERQHALVEAIKATLDVTESSNREEIEMALAGLNPSLSQEIITMRGER